MTAVALIVFAIVYLVIYYLTGSFFDLGENFLLDGRIGLAVSGSDEFLRDQQHHGQHQRVDDGRRHSAIEEPVLRAEAVDLGAEQIPAAVGKLVRAFDHHHQRALKAWRTGAHAEIIDRARRDTAHQTDGESEDHRGGS